MQTNSIIDSFKQSNAHIIVEVDRCMKMLTYLKQEISHLQQQLPDEDQLKKEELPDGLDPKIAEEKYLKIDELQEMIHALSKRAFNYQLAYLKKIDEKQRQLALEDGVQEAVKEKYRKKQEKILKSIRKTGTSRIEDRGYENSNSNNKNVKVESDQNLLKKEQDQKNESQTMIFQQRQTSLNKPGGSQFYNSTEYAEMLADEQGSNSFGQKQSSFLSNNINNALFDKDKDNCKNSSQNQIDFKNKLVETSETIGTTIIIRNSKLIEATEPSPSFNFNININKIQNKEQKSVQIQLANNQENNQPQTCPSFASSVASSQSEHIIQLGVDSCTQNSQDKNETGGQHQNKSIKLQARQKNSDFQGENKISIRKSNIMFSDSSQRSSDIEQKQQQQQLLKNTDTKSSISKSVSPSLKTYSSDKLSVSLLSNLNPLTSNKDDDFEINVFKNSLYTADQISNQKNKFDITQSKLFDDSFFQLPLDKDAPKNKDQYACASYCTAYIHSLNLAAQNLVYVTTGQFIKLYSQRRKANLKKCVQMYHNGFVDKNLSHQQQQFLQLQQQQQSPSSSAGQNLSNNNNEELLKFNHISKVLLNIRSGIWFNSKQQIVWDQDYFNRHVGAAALARVGGATPLEIPQNLLGIDTIPVIFGVATKTVMVSTNNASTIKASGSTKKVQFDDHMKSSQDNHPINANSNSGRKSSSKKKGSLNNNLDQHYRKRSRSRSKHANRKKKLQLYQETRKSSKISDEERDRSSEIAGVSGQIESVPEQESSVNQGQSSGEQMKTYHPFAIRMIDKVWAIFDASADENPIFCVPPSICPQSPTWCGPGTASVYQQNPQSNMTGQSQFQQQDQQIPHAYDDQITDVFTNWARQFCEIKFYTLQRDGKPASNFQASFWENISKNSSPIGTHQDNLSTEDSATYSCGNAEADNWIKLIQNRHPQQF